MNHADAIACTVKARANTTTHVRTLLIAVSNACAEMGAIATCAWTTSSALTPLVPFWKKYGLRARFRTNKELLGLIAIARRSG